MDDDRYLRQVDFLRVMFIALLVLLLMLASGCAGVMELKTKGAAVMDDAVAAAETWRRLCAERGSWEPEQ